GCGGMRGQGWSGMSRYDTPAARSTGTGCTGVPAWGDTLVSLLAWLVCSSSNRASARGAGYSSGTATSGTSITSSPDPRGAPMPQKTSNSYTGTATCESTASHPVQELEVFCGIGAPLRSEEHTSELQSLTNLVSP